VLEVHVITFYQLELSVYYMPSVTLVLFTACSCEGFYKLLALVLGIFKLPLDECTEFILFNIYSTARIIVLLPLGKIWKFSLTAFATTITLLQMLQGWW